MVTATHDTTEKDLAGKLMRRAGLRLTRQRRAVVVAPYGWRQGTDTGC